MSAGLIGFIMLFVCRVFVGMVGGFFLVVVLDFFLGVFGCVE